MSIDNSTENGSRQIPSGDEMSRMIDNGEWEKVKELLTPTEEEVLLALQEPMIDAAEVNRLLASTDEEIESTAKAPPSDKIQS